MSHDHLNLRLIARDEDLQPALAALSGPVAVDTEFHSERAYRPHLKLVQVRDRHGPPLLIDPKALRDLRPLGEALSGRTLIVHALEHDLPLLVEHAGLEVGEVVDPQVLAGFCGMGHPTGLAELVSELLGQEMPRGVSLSNWTRRPLSDEQLAYAAADVRWLHDLADRLTERVAAEGRLDWARRTTEERVAAALRVDAAGEDWRHLPGAAVLDGPGRAALRALFAWREGLARSLDQPRWQVASDAALLDIARRRPADAEALAENRKAPRRLTRELAPELLAVLREAAAIPPEEAPPTVAVRGRAALLDALLGAWALQVELALGVAAGLLLPAELRRDLVLSHLDPRWPAPDPGWREAAFGAAMRDLIEGRSCVRMIP